MKLILALLAMQLATVALGQSADTPPADQATTAPAPGYLFNADKAAMRCEQPALIACLDMDEASCKSAMRDAVKVANAAVEIEAAKEPMTPFREGYLQGLATGRLIGTMTKATNGKFYSCLMKK